MTGAWKWFKQVSGGFVRARVSLISSVWNPTVGSKLEGNETVCYVAHCPMPNAHCSWLMQWIYWLLYSIYKLVVISECFCVYDNCNAFALWEASLSDRMYPISAALCTPCARHSTQSVSGILKSITTSQVMLSSNVISWQVELLSYQETLRDA